MNRQHEQARAELDAILAGLMTDKKMRESDKMLIAHGDAWAEKISKSLKGKSLEEKLGKERAEASRKNLSELNTGKKRSKEIMQSIRATRLATGSYQAETHGMNNKEHKDSTKEIMSIKARVRQELKRQLKLGKSDSVPRDLLEKEYKRLKLI